MVVFCVLLSVLLCSCLLQGFVAISLLLCCWLLVFLVHCLLASSVVVIGFCCGYLATVLLVLLVHCLHASSIAAKVAFSSFG